MITSFISGYQLGVHSGDSDGFSRLTFKKDIGHFENYHNAL